MTDQTRQLDSRVEVVTPENIAFSYELAGPFLRLPAYLIDVLLRLSVAGLGSLALFTVFGSVQMSGLGMGAAFLLWFLLEWFYGGLFEAFWNGQTPGKRLLGIRVLTVEGQPINGFQAVLRNVFRAVDSQPFGSYVAALIACAMNDRFQRLGDLACGVMVVVDRRSGLRGVIRTREAAVLALAERIPPGFQVSRTTARALAAYVERRAYFSGLRRREIARHLAELFRRQLDLPAQVDGDHLLCALYHRTFVGDRAAPPTAAAGSPFARRSTQGAAP